MNGMDVLTYVCGQKADTSSNYCDNIQPYDRKSFRFCQMWQFLDCSSNFRKVVQQLTEGMMGSIRWVLLEIYFSF